MITYLPKQNEALRVLGNSHPARVVLFGGAAGGSKSFIGCAWQISRRFKYPGTRGLIGRSKLDTLKKTTLKTFFEVAGMLGLAPNEHYTLNNQTNIITFSNGSEIILKDLFAYPSDAEFHALGGLELTDAYVDESAQVSKRAIDILQSRIRFKLTQYDLKPKMLLTCNPSKGWLYNEFYAPFKAQALPQHLAFIPSLPSDNPHLPESYIETLRMLPEVDRRRLLDGDWEYDESIDNLFQYDDLLRCFRDEEGKGDMYISADIARLGKDRSVICVWKGLQLVSIHEYRKEPITTIVNQIRELCNKHGVRLTNVIVDEDGVGGGCCDMLRCRGFLNGGRAKQSDRYQNQKAECYFKLAELIEQNKVLFKAPAHRDVIVQELDMIRRRQPEADGKLSVISKEEIARMHGKSPDYADAIMMRMFFELYPNYGSYSWA
jgi:phage terminase large subunit